MDRLQITNGILYGDVVIFNEFKEWVEGTQLFATIKYWTNNWGVAIPEIRSDEIYLLLKAGMKVNRMEDLPKELIIEFFINSPFYNN